MRFPSPRKPVELQWRLQSLMWFRRKDVFPALWGYDRAKRCQRPLEPSGLWTALHAPKSNFKMWLLPLKLYQPLLWGHKKYALGYFKGVK